MYGLCKDPYGEKVFKTPDPEKRSNTGTARSQTGTYSSKNIETVCDAHVTSHAHKSAVEVSCSAMAIFKPHWIVTTIDDRSGKEQGHIIVM